MSQVFPPGNFSYFPEEVDGVLVPEPLVDARGLLRKVVRVGRVQERQEVVPGGGVGKECDVRDCIRATTRGHFGLKVKLPK